MKCAMKLHVKEEMRSNIYCPVIVNNTFLIRDLQCYRLTIVGKSSLVVLGILSTFKMNTLPQGSVTLHFPRVTHYRLTRGRPKNISKEVEVFS